MQKGHVICMVLTASHGSSVGEGGGFMVPRSQVVAANMRFGSLSTPGSIYFVVHPEVKEKCKANCGLFDSRNATPMKTVSFSEDGESA